MEQPGGGRRILIVDDEQDLRDSLQAMLESFGYATFGAGSAAEALSLIQANRPDVILTDIFLGSENGLSLLHALRDRGERIPVLAMSGGGSVADADVLTLATELGAVAVVDKPFRYKNLLVLIERAIAGTDAPPAAAMD
jgi:two-component system nitrogen regulation response regulator NtrX